MLIFDVDFNADGRLFHVADSPSYHVFIYFSTVQTDSFGQKTQSLPRSGDYDKLYGETIKFASIRETVQEVRSLVIPHFCIVLSFCYSNVKRFLVFFEEWPRTCQFYLIGLKILSNITEVVPGIKF